MHHTQFDEAGNTADLELERHALPPKSPRSLATAEPLSPEASAINGISTKVLAMFGSMRLRQLYSNVVRETALLYPHTVINRCKPEVIEISQSIANLITAIVLFIHYVWISLQRFLLSWEGAFLKSLRSASCSTTGSRARKRPGGRNSSKDANEGGLETLWRRRGRCMLK